MKKTLVALTCCGFVLSACAPQDREIVSKEQREQIQARAPKNGFELGSFGVAAFLVEKQGEILQVLATAELNPGQSLGKFSLQETVTRQGADRIFAVKSDPTEIVHGKFKTTQNTLWQFTSSAGRYAGSLQGSVLDLSPVQTQLAERAQLVELLGRITTEDILLSENQSEPSAGRTMKVSYLSSGVLFFEKGGVQAQPLFTMKIEMIVQKFLGDQAELKILSSAASFEIAMVKPVIAKITSENSLVFKMDSCSRMEGKVVIVGTDPSKNRELVFDREKAAVLKTNHKTIHAPCANRPVADLSRILIY